MISTKRRKQQQQQNKSAVKKAAKLRSLKNHEREEKFLKVCGSYLSTNTSHAAKVDSMANAG